MGNEILNRGCRTGVAENGMWNAGRETENAARAWNARQDTRDVEREIRDIRHGTCSVGLEMQGKGSGTMDAGQEMRNRELGMWDMGCRTMDLGHGNRVCASGDMRNGIRDARRDLDM